MKTTPIFPPHIKPVRRGVYKTGDIRGKLCYYSYWDMEKWGLLGATVADAYRYRHGTSWNQNKRWKGLATKDGK